jgi:hypothetical protein
MPLLSRVVRPKGGVFSLGSYYDPRLKRLLSRLCIRLMTKGRGFYISPVAFQIGICRFPPNHRLASLPPSSSPPPLLAVPVPDERIFSDTPLLPDVSLLPDTRAAPSPATGELGRADVYPHRRASPRRGAPPRRGASPRCGASPQRGGPPQLATPAAPDPLPRQRPPALLLGGGPSPPPRRLSSCSRYVAPPPPTPPLAGPPVRSPAGVRVPRWPVGPRWGFALLTSAREMLTSTSILN